jgi:hypothetical protein
MTTLPETPVRLLDALAAIFPAFRAEWEEGESPTTFHGVILRFTPFFGRHAGTLPPEALKTLGELVNAAVARGGLIENAFSTCLLEHLRQISAWRALEPYLSDLSKQRSRA